MADKKEIQEVAFGVDHGSGGFEDTTVFVDGKPVGKLTGFTITSDFPERSPTQIKELEAKEYHCGGKTEVTVPLKDVWFDRSALYKALKVKDPWRGMLPVLPKRPWPRRHEEFLRAYYAANPDVFARRDLFGKRKRIRHKSVKRYLRKLLFALLMSDEIRQMMERPSYARMVLPVMPADTKFERVNLEEK